MAAGGLNAFHKKYTQKKINNKPQKPRNKHYWPYITVLRSAMLLTVIGRRRSEALILRTHQ